MGKADISNKDRIFRDSIGQKATVQRETVKASVAEAPNRMLCDLGLSLNPLPKTDLRYMGSAAVHVYQHEMLNQLFFISQTAPLELYRCPEATASKAFDDLLGTLKAMYGQRRGRLRSGF